MKKLTINCSMCGSQTGNGYTEGATGKIVEAQLGERDVLDVILQKNHLKIIRDNQIVMEKLPTLLGVSLSSVGESQIFRMV